MPNPRPAPAPLDHRYRTETGGCPIEAAFDLLGGRWKGLLLWRLCDGPRRFHELRRSLPHISQRMLVRQLRELERDGLATRSVEAGVPPKVVYAATESALALGPVMELLRDWAARHLGIAAEKKKPRKLSVESRPSRSASPTRGARRLPAPLRTGTHGR
ncbi:putative HTH-type transcriptional regulator YybR [mine drainage metagenome]|uniref:Putative HTH-type transcriptional regulator YybR n=1 Tax=mine drainage metagenome TaxID=410659 RepID=A0A1J5S6A4_9ZZZZ